MAVAISAELFEEMNGAVFLHNEAGEPQLDVRAYHVLVGTNTPGSDQNALYCQHPITGQGDPVAAIDFNRDQVRIFLADNAAYIRLYCNVLENELSNNAMSEIVYLKYLCYKYRLCCPNLDNRVYHVMYNDAKKSDARAADSVVRELRDDEEFRGIADIVMTYLNQHQALVRNITYQFTNLVCTVAYTFRQLGHHYKSNAGYDDTYHRIWKKVSGSETLEGASATWAQIATLGLHSIMPCVLDGFWTFAKNNGRCAAPLNLRYTVPAAGTAAVFALYVGWNDAKSIYGAMLQDSEETYKKLETLVEELKADRWAHGINAQYYGTTTARLDMAPYQAMAATILGVYEACAADATLVQSKSMTREASGAPLQKDISKIAAKALRSIYVKQVSLDAVGRKELTPQAKAITAGPRR